jgi:hypothetical protein
VVAAADLNDFRLLKSRIFFPAKPLSRAAQGAPLRRATLAPIGGGNILEGMWRIVRPALD